LLEFEFIFKIYSLSSNKLLSPDTSAIIRGSPATLASTAASPKPSQREGSINIYKNDNFR